MLGPLYGFTVQYLHRRNRRVRHGTFIKMPAGFVSPVHIHTEDYWGVVISGVTVNGVPGSKDVELPVGSYWFQKGGERHVTKCISPNECIFFISQNGKFDYIVTLFTGGNWPTNSSYGANFWPAAVAMP